MFMTNDVSDENCALDAGVKGRSRKPRCPRGVGDFLKAEERLPSLKESCHSPLAQPRGDGQPVPTPPLGHATESPRGSHDVGPGYDSVRPPHARSTEVQLTRDVLSVSGVQRGELPGVRVTRASLWRVWLPGVTTQHCHNTADYIPGALLFTP